MILSDREILMAVERRVIGISPLPPWGAKAWTSTALDLHLDGEIRPWKAIEGTGQETAINPIRDDCNTNKLIARHTEPQDCTRGFTIGQLIFEEVHGTPGAGYSGMYAVQGSAPKAA